MTDATNFDPNKERGPIAWMAKNGVAANMLMLVLIVGGLVTLAAGIKQEVFPEVELDIVSVQVSYPGASPAEVEQAVVLAVEEAVRGIDGVKKVTSTAMEGMGTITVELLLGADKDRALNDVKSAIDRITSFPEDVERPTVSLTGSRSSPWFSMAMSMKRPSAPSLKTADASSCATLVSPSSSSREFDLWKSASRFPRRSCANTS
ncbi:MAG: efflux RND transporter permease subunit [Deltaproteobacteria bacterium]|nr:MAG: efflux RND transporter permease subunit [Deltaproteobacteria bacterium]